MPEPIDTITRNIAVTEQDINIVVTAGAGTGKTTLLVNRMLHLLLGHKRFQKEESPILRIVAMTFTDKAASEMKIRLAGDRKSTRLNSSHSQISYAVFCLKKK